MPRIIITVLFIFIQSIYVQAQVKALSPLFTDGPYIFYQENQVLAKWMDKNILKEATFSLGEEITVPPHICPDFMLHYEDMESRPVPQEQIHFNTTGKIAALSDVHGQYSVMVKLLLENNIIDEKNNWIFGNGHLVLVGDVFDRGDQVTEILWLLHKLERQAKVRGGRLHILLGNHELMVLSGDLRYVHKKYRYTMAIMKMPLHEILGENSYLGEWLRTKPIAITINDMAFVHGGFSELLLQKTNDIKSINKLGRKLMNSSQEVIETDSLLNLMNTMNGPLWYRGYFDKEAVTKRNIDNILKKINKKHIIVGHTSHDAITPLYNNRIIGVDSSIKFGKKGEILFRNKDGFYRGTITGERIKL